jgi:hypothetical protein
MGRELRDARRQRVLGGQGRAGEQQGYHPQLALERLKYFGAHPIVFAVEPAAPVLVGDAQPARTNHGNQDRRRGQRPVDLLGPVVAGTNGFGVDENALRAEHARDRLGEPSCGGRAVLSAIAHEDERLLRIGHDPVAFSTRQTLDKLAKRCSWGLSSSAAALPTDRIS